MSLLGDTWVKGWRLAFNGPNGVKQFRAYASLLVDRATDWASASLARSFPSFADSLGIALLTNDRLLDFSPSATDAEKAELLLVAPTIWSYAGTPTGLLTALYIAGFPNPVVVQQNGLAFQITDTVVLEDLQVRTLPGWITRTVLPNGNPAIPASTDGRPAIAMLTVPWFTFDAGMDADGNQFTSRFGVLFADPSTTPDLTDASELARLRAVIKKWRGGKETCVGIWVVTSGHAWGEPGLTWGQGGLNWGGAVSFYTSE